MIPEDDMCSEHHQPLLLKGGDNHFALVWVEIAYYKREKTHSIHFHSAFSVLPP
jgi:hypothetical protein